MDISTGYCGHCGHCGHTWHFWHSWHLGQKLVPRNKYPNKRPEKFLLDKMRYQRNIKRAIIKILYNPLRPGNGMDKSFS